MTTKLHSPLSWKPVTVIGLVIIFLICGAYLYYVTERNRIQQEKINELKAITKLKISEITRWREERLSEAEFFPGEKTFIDHTGKLLSNKDQTRVKKYFYETLIPIKENHKYENIFITDTKGKMLYSLDTSLIKLDSIPIACIRKTAIENEIYFTDFYYCKVHKKIHYDIISPIINEKHITIAIMVLRLDPKDYLYPFIQTWPIPSKTAETLIFRVEGNNVLFLNELRHQKNTALKLQLPLSRTDVVAIKAVLGGEGIIEGNDYRGVKVLSDVQRVPGTIWFLVAKIDEAEVYSDLEEIAVLISFIIILSVLLIGTGLAFVYKYRQGNIYKELLQKEKILAETQEEFRTTIYSIGDGVITTDIKGCVMRMNPVAENLTGWKEKEVRGEKLETVFYIINEDTGNPIENPVQKVLQSGVITGLANHTLLIPKNGGKIPIADNGAPIINKEGEIIGVVLVFRDQISEREAEKKLRESEESNRALLNAIPDIIFLLSREGVFLDFRASEQEKLLVLPEQFLGRQISDVLPPEIATITQENLNKLFVNNELQVYEYQHVSGEKIKSYECRLVKSGEDSALAIVRDITIRKRAEENIRKLSRGVEQSPATIIITDINGNIEYVNPKFTEITGYTFDEVKGSNVRILKSGSKSSEEYSELWSTILNKKEWQGEFQNMKKNGELYWELASISPVLDEQGNITSFIAVKEDITERKKMMNELIEAKQKAEEMNRIKTYFYANMSHELRTPFVGIIGFAELLTEILQNPEEKEMAESILKSSKRLTDTLNKILNVTNIEFGKLELRLSGVDVFSMIKNLRILFSKAAEQQNTDIKIDFRCDPFLLRTDGKLLEEILNNLINNAVKFTFDGVIKIIAEIEEQEGRDYFKILVSDTGVGIPQEMQEIIWQEFRQVSEGYSRTTEGTGLGLSIVKKYTELISGNIYVKSGVGKGSTFTLELPLIVEPGENKERLRNAPDEAAYRIEEQSRGYKILLVEDDPTTIDLIKKILSDGYQIDIANNAEEALDIIREKVYDVLLVDINLGTGMSGVELTQKTRKIPRYKSKPIVAVTAYASISDRDKFLSKGFSHYISKPFAANDLKKLLQEALK